MAPVRLTLLGLPQEIRLRIYEYLFTASTIKIENAQPGSAGDDDAWQMKPVPGLSCQLLRTCRQINDEAQILLFTDNIFDCSHREGLKLLLKQIGSSRFALIQHIILDWEGLQDLSWALAKDEYQQATVGLQEVDMATWRTRVLGGTSYLWREVKTYERQLCQSAWEICQRHPRLSVVAERPYRRPDREGIATSSYRVKWRLLTSTSDLRPAETVVNVEAELATLLPAGSEEEGRMPQMDPF